MTQFYRKLQADGVEVLCHLGTFLAVGQCLVVLFDCFKTRNVDRMRIPSVDIFNDELMEDIFEDPMAHLVFANVTFDIAI